MLIFRRIKEHLVNHNILVPEHYGFRDGVSTDTVTYELIKPVSNAWNKKEYIASISCDLTKIGVNLTLYGPCIIL